MLLARAGEGSMRDSLSAFDQVRAFAGETIATEDVVTVLGLVGRDLVLRHARRGRRRGRAGRVRAHRARHRARLRPAPAVPRAVAGDARPADPLGRQVARLGSGRRRGRAIGDRLLALVDRWSREDLLRGFDLLTRAEQEIRELRSAALQHGDGAAAPDAPAQAGAAHRAAGRCGGRSLSSGAMDRAVPCAHGRRTAVVPQVAHAGRAADRAPPPRASAPMPRPASTPAWRPAPRSGSAIRGSTAAPPRSCRRLPTPTSAPTGPYRDAFIAELKSAKPTFYNLVVAQAFSIDANASGVTFAFQPNQKVPKSQCEDNRAWVQSIVEKVIGAEAAGAHRLHRCARARRRRRTEAGRRRPGEPVAAAANRAAALEHDTVQHLLEVFPVEKTTVQEIDGVRSGPGSQEPMTMNPGDDEAGAGGAAAPAAADERACASQATAGGGMVTVMVNGHKHLLTLTHRSRGGVEGRRRDAAGPDRRGDQRRAPQGGRRDEASASAA